MSEPKIPRPLAACGPCLLARAITQNIRATAVLFRIPAGLIDLPKIVLKVGLFDRQSQELDAARLTNPSAGSSGRRVKASTAAMTGDGTPSPFSWSSVHPFPFSATEIGYLGRRGSMPVIRKRSPSAINSPCSLMMFAMNTHHRDPPPSSSVVITISSTSGMSCRGCLCISAKAAAARAFDIRSFLADLRMIAVCRNRLAQMSRRPSRNAQILFSTVRTERDPWMIPRVSPVSSNQLSVNGTSASSAGSLRSIRSSCAAVAFWISFCGST